MVDTSQLGPGEMGDEKKVAGMSTGSKDNKLPGSGGSLLPSQGSGNVVDNNNNQGERKRSIVDKLNPLK